MDVTVRLNSRALGETGWWGDWEVEIEEKLLDKYFCNCVDFCNQINF